MADNRDGVCSRKLPRGPRGLRSQCAVGIIAALLLACAWAPVSAAEPKGQFTWAATISIAPTWFDPAEAVGLITPYMVLYALHDALVKPMPGEPFGLSLAKLWTLSGDGLIYEFVLREGASFHSGELVTSTDVKLLAQSVAPTTAEVSGETVIVAFPLSAPESVEEDVAKEHKLEFVRRLEIGLSDRRIVVYRVSGGRSAAEVVAALKGDVRVSSAQENFRYTLPPREPAPTAVSDAKRHVSRPDEKASLPARTSRAGENLRAARDVVAARPTERRSGQQGSMVRSNNAVLRWPTADEPFANIGARNR
jgi:hypothetical protein